MKQSQRMADWIGGVDMLWEKANEAMDSGDALGAAQLVQHFIRLKPKDKNAKLLMADALAIVAENTFNAPIRNVTSSNSNRYRREADEE